MVVGFNHNFRYKDVLYHIQTEDGGIKSPVIITHLFDGGTILATKKTSYADIIKADSLEQVVEELMKDQHREMLRRLRKGDFDHLIERLAAGGSGAPRRADEPSPSPAAPAAVAAKRSPEPRAATAPSAPTASTPAPPASARPAAGAATGTPAPPPDLADRVLEKSLDDIILSYLLGEDKSS